MIFHPIMVNSTWPRMYYLIVIVLAFTAIPIMTFGAELKLHKSPRVIPNIVFYTSNNQNLQLTQFQGKWLLVNLWATWCSPCRKELPSLDRLQAALSTSKLEVIPIAQETAGQHIVPKYLISSGINNLKAYWDPTSRSQRELRAMVLPTTLLINQDGLEVGRWVGALEWDSAEIIDELMVIIKPM